MANNQAQHRNDDVIAAMKVLNAQRHAATASEKLRLPKTWLTKTSDWLLTGAGIAFAVLAALVVAAKISPLSAAWQSTGVVAALAVDSLAILALLFRLLSMFGEIRTLKRDGESRHLEHAKRDLDGAHELCAFDDHVLGAADTLLEQSIEGAERRLTLVLGSPEKLAFPALTGAMLALSGPILTLWKEAPGASSWPSWLWVLCPVLAAPLGIVIGGIAKRLELVGLTYQRNLIKLVAKVRALDASALKHTDDGVLAMDAQGIGLSGKGRNGIPAPFDPSHLQ